MPDSLCVGTHARVPFVRHDLYFEEWEALGNVLLHGFSSWRYFPVLFSEAFIMHCLFGEAPNDVLINSFLKYLSTSESEVVEAALHCQRYVSTIFHFGDWTKVPKMQSILHDTHEINVSIKTLHRWLFWRYNIHFLLST